MYYRPPCNKFLHIVTQGPVPGEWSRGNTLVCEKVYGTEQFHEKCPIPSHAKIRSPQAPTGPNELKICRNKYSLWINIPAKFQLIWTSRCLGDLVWACDGIWHFEWNCSYGFCSSLWLDGLGAGVVAEVSKFDPSSCIFYFLIYTNILI